MKDKLYVICRVDDKYFEETADILINRFLRHHSYDDFYDYIWEEMGHKLEIPFYGDLDIEDVFELICSPQERDEYFYEYLDLMKEYYEDQLDMLDVGDKDSYFDIPFVVISKEEYDCLRYGDVDPQEIYEKYAGTKG